MSLQILHRPGTLKDFAGNEAIKASLTPILKRKKPPAAFLFTGKSGGGKTTLGRICAKKLGCGVTSGDFIEMNGANDRGIKAIRALLDGLKYLPLHGKKKVILLDECFAKGTLVKTTKGDIPIEDIKIGDTVLNLNGTDTVEKVFKNKVLLSRVVRIDKSDGTSEFCSEDHLFYDDGSWVKAKDLEGKEVKYYGTRTRGRVSKLIQSGLRFIGEKNCYRNRWRKSQSSTSKGSGFKENEQAVQVRVDCVTFYKQGCNDEHFKSVIGDRERFRGYIELYDLQIKVNHSYIAGNLMVHNCHMLTKESQEALLKSLEEPPKHVHFILCTTNPEALKPTLRRRCHNYEVELLKSDVMQGLLQTILKKEKVENFPKKVLEKVEELADGSAGQALKLLDMVIDFKSSKKALEILSVVGTGEAEIKDFCQALINFDISDSAKWRRLASLLKDFGGEAESARRGILGYLSKVLLNAKDIDHAAGISLIMKEFSNHYYDTGNAGLTMSCINAVIAVGEGE